MNFFTKIFNNAISDDLHVELVILSKSVSLIKHKQKKKKTKD